MKIVDVIMESYEWKRENPIRNGMYVYDTGGIDFDYLNMFVNKIID